MSSGLLPDHIEPLVDRLRAGDHLPIALPDVAAVTEILMRSLESYFKSIDLTLYKECQDLADYIEDARAEISSLSPDHDDSAGIPRAGQELDAIVEATESATESIMQSAEDLMSFDSDNFDEYKEHVNTEVMKIFEACSFQDITGQRISKVVKTLNHVEDRVGKLIAILGVTSDKVASENAKPILDPNPTVPTDEELLNGPALAGEGIDQGEVDSLLDDFQPVPQPTSTDEAEIEVEAPVEAAEAAPSPDENTETANPEESASEEIAQDSDPAPVGEPVAEEAEIATSPETDQSEEAPNTEAAEEPSTDQSAEDEESNEKKKVEAANSDDQDYKETSQEDIDSLFG